MNEPSRTDHYIMQNTCEIVRSRGGKARKVQPKDFKIPFVVVERVVDGGDGGDDGDPSAPSAPRDTMPGPLTKDDIVRVQTALAKARYQGLTGKAGK